MIPIALRLAWRRGKRHLGPLAAVIFAIAMAIAVNAALFSVLDGLQFRDLPFEESDELVAVDYRREAGAIPPLAWRPELAAERDALRDRLEASGLVADASQVGFSSFFGSEASAAAAGIEATGVDARFFRMLGVPPLLGRTFLAAEERSPALLDDDRTVPLPVVIGHDLWQRQFGGAADILQGSREVGGRRVQVVGVMPPGVKFPNETNVWGPVSSKRGRPPAIVRLASGASLEALVGAFPQLTFTPLRDTIRPGDTWSVTLLFAAALLLVLVAFVQVAALVSTGIVGRLQELGVHFALGASRARLLRQFWIEAALVLAAALGLAAVATAPVTAFVIGTLPDTLRNGQYLMPGLRTFAFAAALSLAGLIVIGLIPLPILRRANPVPLLAGRLGDVPLKATRARRTFLVAQIALTSCLLYAAALVIQSQVRASTFDHGFDTERVLVLWPPFSRSDGASGAKLRAERDEHYRRVSETVARLNANPAVVAAAGLRAIQLRGLPGPNEWTIERFNGREPYAELKARMTGASPGFIEALGGTLLAGSRFDDPAYAGRTDVAIVNETLANQLAPATILVGIAVRSQVIGARIESAYFDGEIIGIMKDLVDSSPAVPAKPQMFLPSTHRNWPAAYITINARPPLESTLPVIRATLEELWGPIPPHRFGLMRDEIDRILAPFRARSTLLGLIAALCLPLAAVGLAGALLYSIRSREREMAIRIAIGAEPALMRRAVIWNALSVVATGLIVGVGLGALMARLLAHQLFGVESLDVMTSLAVAAVLFAVAWLAALIPARRAAHLDPASVLRSS
jgi:predicted permease